MVQNEIKKLEDDVEALKSKMKSKENNPYFMQVNDFFSEVKDDYVPAYKVIYQTQMEEAKMCKAQIFQWKRYLTDLDYQTNQAELQF